MPQNQLPQAPEVRQTVVRERGRLVSLLAHDTDADVSCLDHVDIIRTITYRKCDLGGVMVPYELDNLFFLLW